MSGLEGHSYLQHDQLEALKKRLNVAESTTDRKVDETTFTADTEHPVTGLDKKNSDQRSQINNLKTVKADKVEYNSRINELTGNDTQHEEKMNELEGILSNKVSQFEFDKMVATLNANDDSQDARLDFLEQQFTDIQTRIVAEITQKTDELVKTTDFNTMVAQLQAGDTGLHNQIIQLASTESIENALTNYQTLLDNLQEKAPYDTEINKLVQRNYDFEQRLLGVDQFFRVLAETYKLHKDDANKTEIKYTAELLEGIPLPPAYEITGYKSYVAGSRSFGTRNTQFEDELSVSFTPFGYNTLTGEIKLYDSSNTLIGSISRADINTASFVVDVPISGSISSLTSLNIVNTSSSGEVIKTETVSQVTIQTLPNITPIRIIESSLSSTDKFTDQNISISTLVEGTGVVTFTPTLPTGLSHTFTNGTLTISGSVSTSISSQQTYTLKISNGVTEDEIPFNLLVSPALPDAPTSLVATSGNGQVSIAFTAGSAGGSDITNYKYSINNGVSYTAFSPAVTTSPVVITGLANGTTYQIKLRAVNSGGDGVESNVVSGTTFNIPSAPTSLVATRGDTVVSIAFTPGSDGGSAITNYKYSINNGTSYSPFNPVDTTSPVVITGLTNGTTYQIKLRAVNAIGDGIESATVSATPMPASWIQRGSTISGESNGDNSGWSVSMSNDGTVVAIGAVYNDGTTGNNDDRRGHVRVYAWSGTAWVKRGADIDGEATLDQSGEKVSLSGNGNVVAIGTRYNDGNGADSGHVRIYEWSGSAWVKRGADIDGAVAGESAGFSVSLNIDGNIVAIGVTGKNNFTGCTRVYTWNSTTSTWIKLGNDIDGEATADVAGASVSLSSDGTIVAIGNFGKNNFTGCTRVYTWNSTTSAWIKRGNDIDGEAQNDNSGFSVSLSSDGTTVAIGAYNNDGNGISNCGHTRIYVWNGTAWVKRGADIDGQNANDNSGYSVSLSSDGTIVAIGERGWYNSNGRVRIFNWNSATSSWVILGTEIGPFNSAGGGQSVSLSSNGNIVAIGAPGNYSSAGNTLIYSLQ